MVNVVVKMGTVLMDVQIQSHGDHIAMRHAFTVEVGATLQQENAQVCLNIFVDFCFNIRLCVYIIRAY